MKNNQKNVDVHSHVDPSKSFCAVHNKARVSEVYILDKAILSASYNLRSLDLGTYS